MFFHRVIVCLPITVAVLLLTGCGIFKTPDAAAEPGDGGQIMGTHQAQRNAESGNPDQRDAFTVAIDAPKDIRQYLEKHLELQRYRQLDDLQAPELSRLLGATDVNARELLNTLGYFTPDIAVQLTETPQDPRAPRHVSVAVNAGELTRVSSVRIDFSGAIAEVANNSGADSGSNNGDGSSYNSNSISQQRQVIANSFSLQPGAVFTQDAWDGAKTSGLRKITAQRYPTARIDSSRAEVDADNQQAVLGVTYDSGPAYRFGPVQVSGSQRYDPTTAARLARVPVGSDYDQARLLEAQQRLASSGYYDSVFLTLDTEAGDPQNAPVIAQVREAPLQKLVFGVGATTDSGARISLDHIHNRVPLLDWRAQSKASFDTKTKSLSTELTSLPDDNQWRWVTSGLLQRETTGTYEVNSGRLRGGRGKSTDHIDRNYYLQYDYAANQGVGAPPSASSVSVNYGWTGRYFNDAAAPSRGYGMAFEVGPGYTLTGTREPFVRAYARWLGFQPLGRLQGPSDTAARQSRLALRAELGTVAAKSIAQLPATQLFLTGGDTTVRGYSYRQIGARTLNGEIFAGRHLMVGSIEWQRPVVWDGKPTDFETTAFLDAGAVADTVQELRAKVGLGAGARWRSPVGPLQADLAYGVDVRRLRLHLRLGFTF